MPARVPEAVRRAWGDELVAEIVPWLEEIVREQAVPRDEYRADIRELHDKMDKMDKRLTEMERHLELRFDQINERFIEMERYFETRLDQMNERFETRFDQMNERFETRLDHRFDQMNARFDLMYERMLTQTRWLIGSIALLGTVISILLAIGQFVK